MPPEKTRLFLAIPLMDELDNLPALVKCLREQTYRNFEWIVCVNHPDDWWNHPEKSAICQRNLQTIQYLEKLGDSSLTIIDRCSPGKGWDNHHTGVGWARKTVMDMISARAHEEDIIVSMDGDTTFADNYLRGIAEAFRLHPEIRAIAAPYHHPLPADPLAARAILRYEIYMRYYLLNMMRIKSPYAFTALGSAISCTVYAYRRIGGLTPHKSGEDFYFLQKLRKFGPVMIGFPEKVFPAARFSSRVNFGTGPAMIRGIKGDWSAYPIYPHRFFDEVRTTFDRLPEIYHGEKPFLPMMNFLSQKFGSDFLSPLIRNASLVEQFLKACHQKIDALRVLQYLRFRHLQEQSSDENNLMDFLQVFFPEDNFVQELSSGGFSFAYSSLELLSRLRDFLEQTEDQWRQQIHILR